MKQKDEFKTRVIFRKFSDNQIIALFPEVEADYCGNIQSYMHLGQHGAADYNHCVSITRLAKPEEYNSLMVELESIGYSLEIRKRR